MTREQAEADPIQEAIDAFNARGETEDFYGSASRVTARRPILATDCDYEIVRVSGVQGVKLPICDMPNCNKRAPMDHPFCAQHRIDCASTHCERRGECASPNDCLRSGERA